MMDRNAREDAIIRDLLERIDDSAELNQRDLARELGIALGMTNAYLKRCVKKGWVKVSQVPARRYRYYLTPKGFREKARLTAQYFTDSLKFFRRARQSFDALYETLEAEGVRRVLLLGADELTEIAVLCALNYDVEVVGVLRGDGRDAEVGGVKAVDGLTLPAADHWIVCSTTAADKLYRLACERHGAERVTYPDVVRRVLGRPE
jgi:DNA-binding MarR family transcriptional regulator